MWDKFVFYVITSKHIIDTFLINLLLMTDFVEHVFNKLQIISS